MPPSFAAVMVHHLLFYRELMGSLRLTMPKG